MAAPTRWKKASYSGGGEGNDCVEIATTAVRIAVRDSKVPARGTLTFPTAAFAPFLAALKTVEEPGGRAR
ncbi:hypothetical protein QFZ75_003212 [Streptomyces sp. V3I8]|uniref:DUF397 domain-containing protein n=1 Tax=Streptomyces sp. V3I8 TaxID=3042279 RepID=UPI0027885359|nr:DUF397 domain-containing protein [Streptomyces sp. V3I8]MDQ1036796.1 hypothetical protein [Streptomyces sp. V3I8]